MFYGQLATNLTVTVNVTDVNTLNVVPYKESFENYELGSTLIGIGGWYGSDAETALIGTNLYAGATPGGYPIPGTHAQSLSFSGGVSNRFEQTASLSNVCVDMLMAFQSGADEPPEPPPGSHIAFWVNSSQHLMVWHGQTGSTNQWTVLPDVVVGTNAFMRLTLMADYARDLQGSFGFRIWIDRVPVTQPSDRFATASTNRNFLSSVAVSGVGQVDDLVVNSYNSMLYRRITTAAGAHGRVAPAGELFVPVGTSTNIAMLADQFYGIGSVTVDGHAAGPVQSYAFTNVWDEHALQADFIANRTSSGVPEYWLNGLNPAWTNNFEAHAQADLDNDGAKNGDEYMAGTDAGSTQSVFRLGMGAGASESVISFPTVSSGGFYGLGGVRRYALEQADDLASGVWQGVPGLTDVTGQGQSVIYTNRFDAADRRFFRGRVWLAP
jgi:hypothetical protein